MRISSSNVDMYSNRTYSAESYQELTIQKSTENVLVLSSEIEEAQEEAGETEENKDAGEVADKEAVSKRTGKIATVQEQKDTKTIRQQCIQYLLEVLLLNRERVLSGQSIRKMTYQEWQAEKQKQDTQSQPPPHPSMWCCKERW